MLYTYTFYMLRYSTYATFPLIGSFSARDTSEQFLQGEIRDTFITYTRHDKLQGAATTIRGPGSCNDAGANFRGSSTRGYKLFNRSVCGTDMSCGCERACVHAGARVALPRLELAICAVVKGNGRCERTLPQVAG